ncbi:MAG: FAD-dependent oxidoreductase [Pikeienuella sp.]
MTSKPDPLLQPYQLKHLTLRNRILSTAHAPSYAEDGAPKDWYRLYHEEKAKGGVALTMIGGSTNIAPDSPSVFGQLYAGDDSVTPWFQRLTDGVKSHGAAIMCQITHMGRRTGWDSADWLPVVGPSDTRERAHRAFPKAMEAQDFTRVIADFRAAAARCRAGGFDGVELLSNSHLIGQFLSPLVNKRDDDYGGPMENRMRFLFDVLSATREEVGEDFILGLRINGAELREGGLTVEDGVTLAKAIEASGQADFLNIVAGAPYDDLGLAEWVPPMGLPSAAHLGIVGAIRAETNLPVFHAGGIADLATARHALTEGHVDMVGMTRAHIADPHLVAKLKSGDETRIRACVGLGYCVDRVNQGKPSQCGQNAATGREAQLPHVIPAAETRKKVVIVGGGPGGMEAARVAAERGHQVVLFEAAAELGGQLRMAASGRTRRQIWGVADWLISEVQALGVDIRTGVYAEAEEVRTEAPDLVIIATGGIPRAPECAGADLSLSSWDVMTGEARVAGEVLLYDEVGAQQAAVAADVLAGKGCVVRFVTPDRAPLCEMGPTTASVGMRDLYRGSVTFEADTELAGIARDGNRLAATLRNVLSGAETIVTVDHVVTECGLTTNDELYHALAPLSANQGAVIQRSLIEGAAQYPRLNAEGRFNLARIGDAVAGRNIHAALLDAMRHVMGA